MSEFASPDPPAAQTPPSAPPLPPQAWAPPSPYGPPPPPPTGYAAPPQTWGAYPTQAPPQAAAASSYPAQVPPQAGAAWSHPGFGAPAAPFQQAAAEQRAVWRRRAYRTMGIGAALFVVGLLITSLTYSYAASNGGGTYIVSWGPMIAGVYRVFVGVRQLIKAGR